MTAGVRILGPNGQVLPPSKPSRSASLAGGFQPHDAASLDSTEMNGWMPYLASADGETNVYRDRIVSRIRDLVRNDGWANGAITRITDNVVGATLRLASKPDYRSLARWGGKGFDAAWANEFSTAAEAAWRSWAEDPGRYADARRRLTMSQIFRMAYRSHLVDGDVLALIGWRPDRVKLGRARYSTVVKLIDPDLLSNPQGRMDTKQYRGGVEVDEDDAAVAYWFRQAHLGDWFNAAKAVTWERIERETAWGRPKIVHWFDADRVGQHRAAGGVLTPVLARMRMLARYDSVELQAAVINAIFAAYIESPFDADLVQDALDPNAGLPAYQAQRASFHADRRLELNAARIPTLFPGEKIATVASSRPGGTYPAFQSSMLRNVAASLGLSAQQLTQDWSDVNYSSARAAMLEAWKTMTRRRLDFATGFCSPIYSAFLEECFEAGELPLPAGAPDFMEARHEYARCSWIGPGRGWVDPVKEPEGSLLRMEAGLSTLERESEENGGADWVEDLDQRALEVAAFKERNLEPPSWLNSSARAAQQQRAGQAEGEE